MKSAWCDKQIEIAKNEECKSGSKDYSSTGEKRENTRSLLFSADLTRYGEEKMREDAATFQDFFVAQVRVPR